MLITDVLLLDYKRCSRRSFLNVHGDITQRNPERDFLLKLRHENQLHVASVLETFYPHYQKPNPTGPSWREKAEATETLMQQGVNCIYQGILLLSEKDSPYDYLGKPHLLIKQPGQSKFGDWSYYPISIHLGRRPKPEYKIVATFYAYLLGILQDTLPPNPVMVLRPQKHYEVDLIQWLPRLQSTLEQCVIMLGNGQEPEVFISRQRCNLCNWYDHCYAIAQSQQHLSLVPGVTPSRYHSLQQMGLITVELLAEASPSSMGEVMGKEIGTQLQQQAQAIVENRAIHRTLIPRHRPEILFNHPVELYFDIEAEPERNLDYLLGVVVVNRLTQEQTFYPFLAETPEDEEKVWQQFLHLVNTYENAPIFHFSEYEVETIKRLGNLYQTPPKQIEGLISRFIDLHRCVITCVIFPVESYSLKSLANWLGFHWRDPGMGGDQCVCWYDQWLKTGNRTFLASILRYNEDDCLATLHLKNWLVEFLR
ncbi:TM0106 family RecB-like putative nuclease [Crocosphaera sp. UHCC 0190]|uniref:TM0106 family RecB-like putative nuclease n=1 Tax=Crocosphaera sp. UHCC 0190 TaxID=3110246 RepID=UPI002B1FA359|nr:TM0106 family RecB-like putative nuclease [Crocosphaera sp. UHCC 0190]MEA5508295.1 TM0106 family RecB-like putative nuclease [Crocosphaera sp. UHCC 0190]